ncbi:unnamed protein product [Phytophthora lilii]|uniref:Unnamed protein product n=1 Tax=Phytophthora lilii TaxID=2077276 RepID=A0A9W6TQ45_9STRA|nr:unnamed protein product [Phytophthora lilii]
MAVNREGCTASFQSYSGGECVAPVDAECTIVSGTSWGCAFTDNAPSAVGSGSGSAFSEEVTFPLILTSKEAEVTFPSQDQEDVASSAMTTNVKQQNSVSDELTTLETTQNQGGENEETACPILHQAGENEVTEVFAKQNTQFQGRDDGAAVMSTINYKSPGKQDNNATVNDKTSYQSHLRGQIDLNLDDGNNEAAFQSLPSTNSNQVNNAYKPPAKQTDQLVDSNYDAGTADGKQDSLVSKPDEGGKISDTNDSQYTRPDDSGKSYKTGVDNDSDDAILSKPGKDSHVENSYNN